MNKPEAFTPDQRLEIGAIAVACLPLCEVRLQNDARWPWLVLLPAQAGLVELEDLAPSDRIQLMDEVVRAGDAVRAIGAATGFEVHKLNVGALGNVVSQLHVHVIGRRPDDAAGLGPVWGVGHAEPYAPAMLEAAVEAARAALTA